jgi:predicted phage-related endonuclease
MRLVRNRRADRGPVAALSAELELDEERKAFLESRMNGIGATDLAALLGLDEKSSPLTVYEEKIGLREASPMSLPAWLGLKLQGTVAELYATATESRVRQANRQYVHPFVKAMVCHLDYRVWGKPEILIECKTRSRMSYFDYASRSYKRWGEDGTADIPVKIWTQVQHEMAVTGAKEAHVAVLFGHHTFRIYIIPRDEEFIGKAELEVDRFWSVHVVPRVPPPVTGHPEDEAALRRRHPNVKEASLKAATPEQVRLVDRYRRTELNKKQVEAVLNELRIKLIEIIGDAPGLEGEGFTISFRQDRSRKETAWDMVAGGALEMVDELLEMAAPGDDDEMVKRLAAIQAYRPVLIGLYTVEKPGSRRFLPRFEGEVDAE